MKQTLTPVQILASDMFRFVSKYFTIYDVLEECVSELSRKPILLLILLFYFMVTILVYGGRTP